MRHTPYESEYAAVKTMDDAALLEYFLTRSFETDEVWFLNDRAGLQRREIEGQTTCPVWPYKGFASDAALEHWQSFSPTSISLDFFLYQRLQELMNQPVMVEIMPRDTGAGCLIAPGRLLSILQGMIDAGEYRLEG